MSGAIQTIQQRTSAQSAGLPGAPSGTESNGIGEGLQSLAAGAQQLNQDLNAIKEREAANWTNEALTTVQQDSLTSLDERKRAAPPGAPNFTPDLLKDYDARANELLSQAPTRNSRAFLQERLRAFRGTLLRESMSFEAAARDDNTQDIVGKSNDAAGNELINNPSVFAERLAERKALIDAQAITPMMRQKLQDQTQSTLAKYAAMGRIQASPYQTMQELMSANPKLLEIQALSPKERLTLIDHADTVIRSQIADAQRIQMMNERAQKKAAETVSKNGDLLLANGQLTADWIEAHRNTMDPSDYRYFYRAMSGEGDAPRNPMIYADLRERAGSGADVRDEARSALQRGAIRIGDYNTVLNEVEQERPGWYKRGSQFISTSAAVSDLNPDPAAAQRKARMLDDWNAWATANPKATDQQAQAEYQRVVQEYAIVDQQNFTITKRAPRYLVGSRNQPDIDATERQTVKAFKDGQIDQAEFERQAALLKEWRQALAHQVKPKQATQ